MGRLVIIEGLWAVGKSTLLGKIAQLSNCVIFSEPDIDPNSNRNNLSMQYWEWFLERDKAVNQLLQSRLSYLVLERTWLSVLAFLFASEKFEDLELLLGESKKQPRLICDRLIYLTSSVECVHERICRNYNQKFIRSGVLITSHRFLRAYKHFLEANLELLHPKEIVIGEYSSYSEATISDISNLLGKL